MGKTTIPHSIPVIGTVYIEDLSPDDKFIVTIEPLSESRKFLALSAALAAGTKALKFTTISTEKLTEDTLFDIKRFKKGQTIHLSAILNGNLAKITRIGRVPKKAI
ncbi:MAG: hypothetical protein HY973_01840 [Candidatus Kerfeldbacteria bacterium]|nr:hypothetical protein [Candidatus Kerfeldbacteria bacterium]